MKRHQKEFLAMLRLLLQGKARQGTCWNIGMKQLVAHQIILIKGDHSLSLLQPQNRSVHKLCKKPTPPQGTTDLLGLGLKFCTVPPMASPKLKYCVLELAYNVRTKHFLLENIQLHRYNIYPSTIYISSLKAGIYPKPNRSLKNRFLISRKH